MSVSCIFSSSAYGASFTHRFISHCFSVRSSRYKGLAHTIEYADQVVFRKSLRLSGIICHKTGINRQGGLIRSNSGALLVVCASPLYLMEASMKADDEALGVIMVLSLSDVPQS
jgi:hypothetical protein